MTEYIDNILYGVSFLAIILGLWYFVQSMLLRKKVLREIVYAHANKHDSHRSEEMTLLNLILSCGDKSNSPHNRTIMREVAREFQSEIAVLLTPPLSKEGSWNIRKEFCYIKKSRGLDFFLTEKDELFKRVWKDKIVVIDTELGDDLPISFYKAGISCAIAALVQPHEPVAILIIGNRKDREEKSIFRVRYNAQERNLAAIVAKTIPVKDYKRESENSNPPPYGDFMGSTV